MPNYRKEAQALLRQMGGIGALEINPQQVGQALRIMAQQPGVGVPAQMVQAGANGRKVVSYEDAGYSSGGLTYCGFGITALPAGVVNQQVTIVVRRPFLPQLVYCPSTTFGYLIDDFAVEGMGLFASNPNQGMPNELVSEVSNIEQIQWPTLNPSTNGQFLLSNPTGGILNFSGAFWGTNLVRGQ